MGWYWQPLGLVLATCGTAALVWRLKTWWHFLFWGLGMMALAYFCYDLRNNPAQPFAMRRFTPFALPVMVAGVSAFPWFGNSRKGAFALITATAAVLVGFAPINARINSSPDYSGSIQYLDSLARQIPSNAIVLIRAESSLSNFGIPLLLVHHRACLLVSPPQNDPHYTSIMSRAISAWTHSGHPVFLLTDSPLAQLSLFNIGWSQKSEDHFDTMNSRSANSQVGNHLSRISWNYILLQAVASTRQSPPHMSQSGTIYAPQAVDEEQ
jgi:hypothetical protein